MSAKFSNNIRNLVGETFISSITTPYTIWTGTTLVQEGQLRYYGNNLYVAKTSGTTGTNPPVHPSGTDSDGLIEWIWVRDLLDEKYRNIYLSIGKNTEWDDENDPDETMVTDFYEEDFFNNIMTLIKLNYTNFKIAAKRYNWTSGTIYDKYYPTKDPLETIGSTKYDNPFYVLTSSNNIYKCLENNSGAESTVEPTGMSTSAVKYADGYVWKYICSLGFEDSSFVTTSYVPIDFKKEDDGSTQWDVQIAAKPGSLSSIDIKGVIGTFGAATTQTIYGTCDTQATAMIVKDGNNLSQIILDNIGEGYSTDETVYCIVKYTAAAGSGAAIDTITVTDGEVTDITIDTGGSNYTSAICILVDLDKEENSDDASLTVNITNNSVTGITIVDGGSGYSNNVVGYIIPGTSGAVGYAVFAPKNGHGHNARLELAANTIIMSCKLTGETDYLLIGEDYSYRQVGLILNPKNYVTDDISLQPYLIGPAHEGYNGELLYRAKQGSGDLLYANNITKIIRGEGQEENIKIALSF